MHNYEFTVDWFSHHASTWIDILPKEILSSRQVLEIGSFEGRSAVWMLENILHPDGGKVYCIDTWEGSIEHQTTAMPDVERRFDKNIEIALAGRSTFRVLKLKGTSNTWISNLLARGHGNSFDFIYIDGSHQAPNVLTDLVGAFQLCRIGGVIVCDDYLWEFGHNPATTPKLAIDAFVNCFAGKLQILPAPLFQVFIIKKFD